MAHYMKRVYILLALLTICIASFLETVEAKRQYVVLSPVGANELAKNIEKDVKDLGITLTRPSYSKIADDTCLFVGFNQDGCISVYTYDGLISNIEVEFDLINHAPAGARSTMADGVIVLGAVLMELGAEEQDIHTGLIETIQHDVFRSRKDDFKKTYIVYSRGMKHNLEITVETDGLSNEVSFGIWAFQK